MADRGLHSCDTQALRDSMLGRRDDVFLAFVGTPSPRATASGEWLHEASVRENGPWLTVTLALLFALAWAWTLSFEVVDRTLCPNPPPESKTLHLAWPRRALALPPTSTMSSRNRPMPFLRHVALAMLCLLGRRCAAAAARRISRRRRTGRHRR